MTKALLELARSISPETIAKCGHRVDEPKTTVAERNEAKYADLPSVREQIDERIGMDITSRYRDIRAGSDNGNCTTRWGTYRKLKTGDGRFLR